MTPLDALLRDYLAATGRAVEEVDIGGRRYYAGEFVRYLAERHEQDVGIAEAGQEVRCGLRAERIAELEKENDALREDAAKVLIEELHATNSGGFDALMRGKIGAVFAEMVKMVMDATGAANFTVCEVTVSDGTQPYYIRAGRLFGDSIEKKYMEACAERDRLRAELGTARPSK